MISYHIVGEYKETEVTVKKFKDGCVCANINNGFDEPYFPAVDIEVTVRFGEPEFTVNDTLFALAQTVDALRQYYPRSTLMLHMPYVPYARQDRVTVSGESNGLKRLGKFINDLDFVAVSVFDPHSTVMSAAIDRMYRLDKTYFFKGIKKDWSETYIVAPDAGATKSCEQFAKDVGAAGVITCRKDRNPQTADIGRLEVIDYIDAGMNEFFILDDIIDGGRTFIRTKEAICDAVNMVAGYVSKMELAVTHGLFTYGADVVASHFDHVYTTNSYLSDKDHPKVTVLNFI